MKIKYIPAGICVALAVVGTGPVAWAQAAPVQLPFDSVQINNLSAFRAPGSNWRVVGEALADRSRAQRLQTTPGSGVLVNVAPAERGANLFSNWEHGDLDLELDFMVPRGSNSGVYLQGRYEVQLFDSWGVKNASFSDAGAIYQRWDPQRGQGREGFEGQPPRVNASRAPGLWQHLRIIFRAPRFDAQGRKTANARFVRVEHNGVVVHENVEVTGPTRAATFNDEKPTGPLMLQGDHGPVAFRNIHFKRYGTERVRLSDVRFRAYEGQWTRLPDLAALTPSRQGAADAITPDVAGVQDKYAVGFDGVMEVPTSGTYLFDLGFNWIGTEPQPPGQTQGGGRLLIDGRDVILHAGTIPGANAQVQLPAGRHRFSLTFFKNRPWTDQNQVAFFVEGNGVARQALHDEGDLPRIPGAITVEPNGESLVLRSFIAHGDKDAKRTHAISVGNPGGAHYSYDANRAALLYAWHGPFLETTPMWSGRGEDQLAVPVGSVIALSGAPALASLPGTDSPWPDSLGASGYRFEGYALDERGQPTFMYRVGEARVEDRIRPSADGNTLRREFRLRGADTATPIYARVAEGERVRRLRDGSYAVGDFTYYVAVQADGARPTIRDQGGRQELLVPLRFRRGEAKLSYDIIW